MILITLILVLVSVLVFFWLFCFFYQHDFSIPLFDPTRYKKVLAIFPHPDDEVATIGGTLQYLSSQGSSVSLLTMTHGEAGETCIPLTEPIGVVRSKELKRCAHILGIHSLILEDFGDGRLSGKKDKLRKCIQSVVSDIKPDLVITFDTAGLYGHPDHIALSEAVTDVMHTHFPKIILWYTTETKRVYAHAKLPTFMAKDPLFLKRRSEPTYRIWVGPHVLSMTRALYTHHCQLGGFKKSLPVKLLPVWFFTTMRLFEYVHET